MSRTQGRDSAKERHWRGLLRLWRHSGLTGRAFCAQHRLSEPSFYSWKREIARRDQERADQHQPTRPPAATLGAFVPLTLSAASAPAAALEVVLAGGRVLRVAAGFDATLLRQLLAVLEEPSC